MKKHIVAILAAIMTTSMLFTGCGNSGKEGSGEVTEINYWYAFKDKIGENNEALVKEFNESQDKIKVVAEYQGSYDELHSKTKAAFAAKDAPEVTLNEIASLNTFATSGMLEDLTPFVEKDKVDVNDYHAGLMENSYVDNKLYGIPYLRSTPVLYVNSKMLEEAGLDPAGPKSWDEMKEYCKKLSNGDTVGLTMPVNLWFIEGYLAQAGGSVLSADNKKASINSPEAKRVVEYLKSMNDEGIIRIVDGTEGSDKAKIDFKNQKCAMIFSSTADLTYNLQVAEESGFTINTAFMPKDKNYGVPTGGCNMVMTSGLSKEKQDAAWEFIKFMTDKDRTIKASKNTGYLPTRKSAVDSEEMKGLYEEKPQFKVAVDQLEYAKGRPMVNNYAEIQKVTTEALERIFLQNSNIDTELTKVEKDINGILDK